MKKPLIAAGLVALGACADSTGPAHVSPDALRPMRTLATGDNTVIVGESDVARQAENTAPTRSWVLYTRTGSEAAAFVTGPGSPPIGSGSLHLVTPTGAEKATLFNYDHVGTLLSAVQAVSYRTYKTSVSPFAFPSINIQIDINGGTLNTGEFRTLVFEPYHQPGFVDQTGVWETRDAYAAGAAQWWVTGAGLSGACVQASPCAWSDITAAIPAATIVGGFGVNQGSGNGGLDAAADGLRIGYGGNAVTYNFENFTSCAFVVTGTTMKLQGNCETTKTILVPAGFTLNGNGFTITGRDPAGGHFVGGVIANAGASANVTNTTVTVSGLADICDGGVDRLRGILFDGAAGSISNNRVLNLRQGVSGCQEGNGIEARNAPFDNTGTDLAVSITGNTVSNYQKTGILVSGSIAAVITGNTVTGAGPINYIAQNGIQLGFGATATVSNNSASGNNYTGPDVACGLLLFEADGVKSSKNTFANNERDNCNFGKGGGTFNPSP
ncbi:MAG TPA: right-handed parallel beta-helix repeat-containing protein [Gemmatimonadaceae bacterium]|nr:right-handed parallel beta-helix repeat-containing protein [Gemmatimonadaceae bacterium]